MALREITDTQLTRLLTRHKNWLDGAEAPQDFSLLNLNGRNLSHANLSKANLQLSDLSNAKLAYANLSKADLSYANLSSADLSGTDLSYADMTKADLRGNPLKKTLLVGANLSECRMEGAALIGADLSNTTLSHTHFGPGTDLSHTRLTNSYLLEIGQLRGIVGNEIEIKSLRLGGYDINYTAEHMVIDNSSPYSMREWWEVQDSQLRSMLNNPPEGLNFGSLDSKDERLQKWWKTWKPILQQIISTVPAKPGRGSVDL